MVSLTRKDSDIDMGKTSNICVKVKDDVKVLAEGVLNRLGISMSDAISDFLKQVIAYNRLPFDVNLLNKPISILNLNEDEFNLELKKAENDFKNGKVYSLDEVKKELFKGLD